MVSIPVKNKSGSVVPMTIEQKLAKSRMMARNLFPYWAPVINSLILIEVPSVKTMGVSHNLICAYNRDFVERMTLTELMWVWIHEAIHILNKHCERYVKAIGKNDSEIDAVMKEVASSPQLTNLAKVWNIAADAAANQKLETVIDELNKHNAGITGRMGSHKMPKGYVSPAVIEMEYGNSSEYYYQELLKKQKEEEKENGDEGDEGENENNEAKGDSSGGDSGDEEAGDGDSLRESKSESDESGDSKEGASNEPGKGISGSSAVALAQPWESEIPENAGRDKGHVDLIVESTAREVERYASKGIGFVPGSIKQWSKSFLEPPHIDWTLEFSAALSNTAASKRGMDMHKFGKISRTQMKMGGPRDDLPIHPSRVSARPRIAVVGDTSGSMGREELASIIGTVKSIVEATEADVLFCSADAAVGEITEIENWEEVADSMTGGGGTDFYPAFEALEKEFHRPETVVYVTDGGGAAPDEQPDWCDVIWVLVGRYREIPYTKGYHDRIDWGEYVYPDVA